ncbi:hypothetical protein OAA60_05400 [Porticoccaceae bacterium]|jgi:curved DNA-binding protein CbpA|nr:hypothetical protein [Porticoccaceae bacterium]
MKFTIDLDMSLDINDYTVSDLILLFKIPHEYTDEHLAHCKKIVRSLHPDKTTINPDYFRLFYKAYNKLREEKTRYLQTTGSITNSNRLIYNTTNLDRDNNYNIKDINPGRNGENVWDNQRFVDKFNSLYEPPASQEAGYGNWLEDESTDNCTIQSSEETQVARTLDDRSINTASIGGFDLIDTGGKSYSSDIFSSFGFTDVKQAYEFNPCSQYENKDEVERYIKSQQQSTTYNPLKLNN